MIGGECCGGLCAVARGVHVIFPFGENDISREELFVVIFLGAASKTRAGMDFYRR
jgi:hypothetical protein